MSDYNQKVMAEFRANDGIVGGHHTGRKLLILHTTGAKSGKHRETPLVTMQTDDGKDYIIASAGGSPKHPAWYHNLVANPDVHIEVGTEKYDAIARVADEPERTQLYNKIASKYDFFIKYERDTERTIPVIVLERT
ncbi:MAG: nitroreductase/quinone reductase family protein [Chloroflexota bacterium]